MVCGRTYRVDLAADRQVLAVMAGAAAFAGHGGRVRLRRRGVHGTSAGDGWLAEPRPEMAQVYDLFLVLRDPGASSLQFFASPAWGARMMVMRASPLTMPGNSEEVVEHA